MNIFNSINAKGESMEKPSGSAGITMLKAAAFCFLLFGLAIGDVTVTVDWNTVKRNVDTLSFGMNVPAALDPKTSGDTGYLSSLKYITMTSRGTSAAVRLHQWGMLSASSTSLGWLNNGQWDSAKVKKSLKPLVDNKFSILINIPCGPGGGSDFTDFNKVAQFCADLVRIVNIDAKYKVRYWEVPNERDQPGMLDAPSMANLVKTVYSAMKAVDTSIQVGGPAMSVPNLAYSITFLQNALPKLDFFSFHLYVAGSSHNASDAAIYNVNQSLGNYINSVRTALNTKSPDRYIPIWWDEYNIQSDWTYLDPRVRTNKGGVLDALVMVATVDRGGDVSNIWNDIESTFGIMDPQYRPYVPAHVFSLFNRYFMGEQVGATSTDSSLVVPFAVSNGAVHSIALINRSPVAQKVLVDSRGWAPKTDVERHQVWSNGYPGPTVMKWSEATAGMTLPDNSVTVVTVKDITAVRSGGSRYPGSGNIGGNRNVRVELFTVSGRLLSAFNVKSDLSAEAIGRKTKSFLPGGFGDGVYLVRIQGQRAIPVPVR
jgi:xylan 1,4-beta-xylosidase